MIEYKIVIANWIKDHWEVIDGDKTISPLTNEIDILNHFKKERWQNYAVTPIRASKANLTMLTKYYFSREQK